VLIPLVPLVRARLVKPGTICVSSMSGVSGAGRNAKLELIYPECNESLRAYSVPKHRHLAEIEQELTRAANEPVRINFTPHLVPVTRGIHTTIYVAPAEGVDGAAIGDAFRAAYADAPFVRLLGESGHPDTLNVTGTNFIDVAWRHDLRTGRIILLSAEDNLTKGAAGQAVQCYNIAQGWPETSGLD
jgi:N-acetyl-gamma-glutamyl-phosphate reductase